ncbi:hypothetical protein PsorP6_012161 [Peronosclerospora sorghi]|uniref:Uncharacterized protein n=1 Tax=Peronosclerospora sorghi TaxID=230839 RepID=A0ACC0WLS1_9STRA|nr:hypothetical protein PsorP6_012161 [Peronosclerospora sorghi]
MTIPRQGYIAIAVILVLAVVGIVLGVVMSQGSSKANSELSSKVAGFSSSFFRKSRTIVSTITSDPTSVTYALSAFAIGDWGTSIARNSSCLRSSTSNHYDISAEDVAANVMSQQANAADISPVCVIGQGDSFYGTGMNRKRGRPASRFRRTFESNVKNDKLRTLPWVTVRGPHDYGRANFICSHGDSAGKCSSADDLLRSLKTKFAWQSTDTSPNDAPWTLDDHFHVYRIRDEARNVSMDIFNVDSGDADVHGAKETCCQCYGYAGGKDEKCVNIARGHDVCCGGDVDMFDRCMAQFTAWSDDSRKRLEASIAQSAATWLVVNSYYSPYDHYAEAGMIKWFNILNGSGVHLWLNGHTHGESHDYSSSLGIHFVDNGVVGGMPHESAGEIPTYAQKYVKKLWGYDRAEYGFFSLTVSADWLKLQYHTADDKWSYATSFNSTTVGGVATKHCWYIPNDGTEGKECTSMWPAS